MEPRIAARVVEAVLDAGPVTPSELPAVRGKLAAEAQAAFDAAYSAWKHAEEFEVQIVVVSLYLTDSSVGREVKGTRFGW